MSTTERKELPDINEVNICPSEIDTENGLKEAMKTFPLGVAAAVVRDNLFMERLKRRFSRTRYEVLRLVLDRNGAKHLT